MAQHIGSTEWINTYLEWTNAELSLASAMNADTVEDIATAYLE